MDTEDLSKRRCVKFKDQCAYEWTDQNRDQNKNSAIVSVFIDELKDEDRSSRILLLAALLKEQFFFQLRTTEQLGYLVSLSKVNYQGINALKLSV